MRSVFPPKAIRSTRSFCAGKKPPGRNHKKDPTSCTFVFPPSPGGFGLLHLKIFWQQKPGGSGRAYHMWHDIIFLLICFCLSFLFPAFSVLSYFSIWQGHSVGIQGAIRSKMTEFASRLRPVLFYSCNFNFLYFYRINLLIFTVIFPNFWFPAVHAETFYGFKASSLYSDRTYSDPFTVQNSIFPLLAVHARFLYGLKFAFSILTV